MIEGWSWLNQNAWIASALLVCAFLGGAVTMTWHIAETHSRRSSYLVVVALLVLAASFVLTGVSVGENPIVPGRELIPIIRLLWLAAAILLNAFIAIYWAARVQWKGKAVKMSARGSTAAAIVLSALSLCAFSVQAGGDTTLTIRNVGGVERCYSGAMTWPLSGGGLPDFCVEAGGSYAMRLPAFVPYRVSQYGMQGERLVSIECSGAQRYRADLVRASVVVEVQDRPVACTFTNKRWGE